MKKFLLTLSLIAGLASVASALEVPSFINRSGTMFTNAALFAQTNTTVVTATSNSIAIPPIALLGSGGFSVAPLIVGTNANQTNSITFYWELANDIARTNFSTTHPLQLSMYANGTTPARGFTNFADTAIANATAIRFGGWYYAQTNLGFLSISNITYGYTFAPLRP